MTIDYDYVVVGAGLTGATFARMKADAGFRCLVVDRRIHVAGNAYDYLDDLTGLYVHEYGPHLFHTNSEKVYNFLSRFTKWRHYEHRVRAGERRAREFSTIPLPVNFLSIELMGMLKGSEGRPEAVKRISVLRSHFKENQRFTLKELRTLAEKEPVLYGLWEDVHNNIFANYTQKMWKCSLEELGPTVADRVPLIAGYDDRYFSDTYQCMPVDGYTMMVERMLGHELITVELGREYQPGPEAKKVFFTGKIDEIAGYEYGQLPYRGMTFYTFNYMEDKAPDTGVWFDHTEVGWDNASTMNYPGRERFTRVSSMSRIGGRKHIHSRAGDIRVLEEPSDNGSYYPIPKDENRVLYSKYEKLMSQRKDLLCGGRLGSYQYLNLDQAVAQGMKKAKEF